MAFTISTSQVTMLNDAGVELYLNCVKNPLTPGVVVSGADGVSLTFKHPTKHFTSFTMARSGTTDVITISPDKQWVMVTPLLTSGTRSITFTLDDGKAAYTRGLEVGNITTDHLNAFAADGVAIWLNGDRLVSTTPACVDDFAYLEATANTSITYFRMQLITGEGGATTQATKSAADGSVSWGVIGPNGRAPCYPNVVKTFRGTAIPYPLPEPEPEPVVAMEVWDITSDVLSELASKGVTLKLDGVVVSAVTKALSGQLVTLTCTGVINFAQLADPIEGEYIYFSIAGDGKSATATLIDGSFSLTLDASATVPKPVAWAMGYWDYQGLEDVGIEIWVDGSQLFGYVDVREDSTIVLKAPVGFEFVSAVLNDPIEPTYASFTLSAAKTIATLLVPAGAFSSLTVVKQAASEPEPEPEPVPAYAFTSGDVVDWLDNKFTMKLNSVTVSGAGSIFTGDVIDLTTTDGYTFNYVNFYRAIEGDFVNFALGVDSKTATLTMGVNDSYTFNYATVAPVVPDPKVLSFSYTASDVGDWVAAGMSVEVNDVPVNAAGGDVYIDDMLTIKTGAGYKFNYAYFFDVYDEVQIPFTFNVAKTMGTLLIEKPLDVVWLNYDIEVSAEVVVAGSNRVFKITDEQLGDITTKRFMYPVGSIENVVDFGKYILGLIKLPFTIDPSYIVGYDNVKLGVLDTGVIGAVVNTDRITYSLGSISVGGITGNSLDFINTTAVLHLPYSNPVNLDIDYVMNETVSIDLVISMYDGSADYNISSSKIGGVVFTQKVQLGINIPFANLEGVPNKNAPDNIDFGVSNGVKTAYIELLKNEAVLPYGFFTTPVLVEGTLLEQSGFVVVEDIMLSVPATTQEKEMIKSALSEGVVVL